MIEGSRTRSGASGVGGVWGGGGSDASRGVGDENVCRNLSESIGQDSFDLTGEKTGLEETQCLVGNYYIVCTRVHMCIRLSTGSRRKLPPQRRAGYQKRSAAVHGDDSAPSLQRSVCSSSAAAVGSSGTAAALGHRHPQSVFHGVARAQLVCDALARHHRQLEAAEDEHLKLGARRAFFSRGIACCSRVLVSCC